MTPKFGDIYMVRSCSIGISKLTSMIESIGRKYSLGESKYTWKTLDSQRTPTCKSMAELGNLSMPLSEDLLMVRSGSEDLKPMRLESEDL